ncbi:MAG: helix-turn-helix domain-containing protein [Chloroflexi bacterium]|nr:helix-turn-helix domain-containing protein [Chloroflexota bacterium]
MNIEDTIWLLAHSSSAEDKREWAVLYWKSQGLKHEEIADKWGYSIQWVQRYMTKAYERFGIPKELDKYEKYRRLEQEVFPIMRKFIEDDPESVKVLPSPPTEFIEESEPKTQPKRSIAPVAPQVVTYPPKPSRFVGFLRLVLVVLVISIVGITAYVLGMRSTPSVPVVITATFPPASETPLLSPTLPPLPTDTLVPTLVPTLEPTFTALPPTATAFVIPDDGILFQDTFDTDKSTEWNVYSGDWLVSGGRLTLLPVSDYIFQWIGLKDHGWKNYSVSLDLFIPSTNSNDPTALVVRTKGAKQIGFSTDWRPMLYLSFIEGPNNSLPITSEDDAVDFPESSATKVQIDVQGDTYTLRMNGQVIQTLTMSGHDTTNIQIGAYCSDTKTGCPSFDNFKVTYLP